MLIPKADRKKIHEYLFRGKSAVYPMRPVALIILTEGVLVAKKDFNLPKHNEIDTKNLFVSVKPYRSCLGLTKSRSSRPASPSRHAVI